jgi:hypothetical protein
MPANNPTAREYAALAYALAQARAQLTHVEMGDAERAETAMTLEGTSTASIAAALGLREADLAVDWNEHLTQAELDKIARRR